MRDSFARHVGEFLIQSWGRARCCFCISRLAGPSLASVRFNGPEQDVFGSIAGVAVFGVRAIALRYVVTTRVGLARCLRGVRVFRSTAFADDAFGRAVIDGPTVRAVGGNEQRVLVETWPSKRVSSGSRLGSFDRGKPELVKKIRSGRTALTLNGLAWLGRFDVNGRCL